MAGYLDSYGAGEERREKIIKRTALAVVLAVVAGAIFWALFHDYPEERQAKRFFESLKAGDYKSAYAMWGCTASHPCRDYAMPEFMKDWGPSQTPLGDIDVLDGESCGSGVIVDVDTGKSGEKKLWVERDTHVLGYPPFERCPQGNRIHDWWRNLRYRLHGRPVPAGS